MAPVGRGRKREVKRSRLFKVAGEENGPDRRAVIKRKLHERHIRDEQDSKFGYDRFESGPPRLGWLLNIHETIWLHPETSQEMSALDCFFLQDDGDTFKATFSGFPYLYILCKSQHRTTMEGWLLKRYPYIKEIVAMEKVDLDLTNHLSGLKQTYLKVMFHNKNDQELLGRKVRYLVNRNKAESGMSNYAETFGSRNGPADMERELLDIREYDVPFLERMCIDNDLRVGKWFEVTPKEGGLCNMKQRVDMEVPAEPKIFAYDIETCKSPLKFPKADRDQIMMISYMIDDEGYLITNRAVVSKDIEDFEYTPKKEYVGVFSIFNEPDEKALIVRFFEHIKEEQPHVYVTYNGDFFDWPYVMRRAEIHGLSMEEEIGVYPNRDIFGARFAVHIDCFNWVQRDSYLPQGSQGLKAVTRYKLGYNPVELDPEDMEPFARTRPQELATYSVSDAVATYYLFKKYVQAFIFSLCGIIPMNSGDVLRKGSGTLCEMLLMVQAYKMNIICPNKQNDDSLHWYKKRLLDSETYIGGHVEAFESGVFREDFKYKFVTEPEAYQELIDEVDDTIKFFVEVESNMKMEDVTNAEEVKQEIVKKLEYLRDNPRLEATPLIYHLDVAAMYPNIILTNRLQPVAVVDQATCAACDFNRPGNNCQRQLDWRWRGKYYPASKGEVKMVQANLEVNQIPKLEIPDWRPPFGQEDDPDVKHVMWIDINSERQRNTLIKKRVKEYGTKVYKKQTVTVEEDRKSTICQRENGFYVDTVQAFRDRRYTYKGLTRKWKGELKNAKGELDKQNAAKMVTLYDSLQLAHKCILNSFYGYVMRRGARWYSMPMAAITTHIGGTLIKMSHHLCNRLGRPLELDTDGIWTLMPGTFPEEFDLLTPNHPKKKKITLEYPGSMLNIKTHQQYTNHQFQTLEDQVNKTYKLRSECSIFFEVDGPYLAMVLPASTEEGRKLKKRYAVFNRDHSLAELKGFEIKRRGELHMIKYFQKEIFKTFLKGTDLQTCYDIVGAVSKRFIDIIDTKAVNIPDHDIFDLITENKNMSKSLEEYGNGRSTAITCAKRIASFLGNEMLEGGGLQCKFIISAKPFGASVSDRAIPVEIFKAEKPIMKQFLRKWTKDHSMDGDDFDIRNIIDWAYYRKRIGGNIQKIVTIPAAMQKISNPLPQLAHPDWLDKKLREINDPFQQRSIKNFFKKSDKPVIPEGIISKKPKGPRFGEKRTKPSVEESIPDSLLGSLDMDTQLDEPEAEEATLPDGSNPLPVEGADQDWLEVQVKSWRSLNTVRRKRKREKAAVDFKKGRAVKKTRAIADYMDKLMDRLYRAEWQVVQIAPTNEPGTFSLWAFTDKQTLQQIRVRVQRTFYVNTEDESSVLLDKGGEKVSRTLPRGRPCLELIQMRMPERQFELQRKNIQLYMTKAHVEGVYEMHVPPEFRAVVHMGCVVKVARGTKRRPEHSSQGFDLTELDFKTIPSSFDGYLSNVEFSTAFFYMSQHSNGRALLSFVQRGEGNGWSAHSVAVNPFPSPIEGCNLQAALDAEAQSMGVEAFPLEHSLIRVKSLAEGYHAMKLHLEEYKGGRDGSTIVLAQSPLELMELYRNMPPLQEEFPVVTMPYTLADGEYPGLQWYPFAAKTMIKRFINSPEWFERCCQFSRFLHCPIGNFPKDVFLFATDVFFARHLNDHKNLWWVSTGPRPDLGGQEEDENLFDDEHKNPEVCNPGMYTTVCVELSLSYLHVNAILQADDIISIEADPGKIDGEEGDGKRNQTRYTFDDASSCRESFKILKKLVTQLTEVAGGETQAETNTAQNVLEDLYRWLRSPRSLLFDPLLHRYVHKIMKKVFVQLLTKLKSLSARIVYASFNKLIIDTGRTSLKNAASFVKFSIETLGVEYSLFQWIEFEWNTWWGYLAFLDPANYGGFELVQREGAEMETEEDGELDPTKISDDNYVPNLVMDWNIEKFLPEDLQQNWHAVVADYLNTFYEKLKEMAQKKEGDSERPTQQVDQNDLLLDFDKYRQNMLEDKLAPKMYRVIEEIHGKYPPDSRLLGEQAEIFPLLPGSHLPLHHPGLEFIKYLTRVLELDAAVRHQVLVFKKNALKLVQAREFGEATEFENPCATHVLPDMVCVACSGAADLDVCRSSEWPPVCPVQECGEPYDTGTIENRLVEVVTRRHMAYQVQDLKCTRCGLVKACLMSEYCECSGSWKNTIEPDDFCKEIRTFVNIAKYHQFEFLLEATSWIARIASPIEEDNMVG